MIHGWWFCAFQNHLLIVERVKLIHLFNFTEEINHKFRRTFVEYKWYVSINDCHQLWLYHFYRHQWNEKKNVCVECVETKPLKDIDRYIALSYVKWDTQNVWPFISLFHITWFVYSCISSNIRISNIFVRRSVCVCVCVSLSLLIQTLLFYSRFYIKRIVGPKIKSNFTIIVPITPITMIKLVIMWGAEVHWIEFNHLNGLSIQFEDIHHAVIYLYSNIIEW